MPARKRQYTDLSDDRYFEKAVKMHVMHGIPVEVAVQHARNRLKHWKAGFQTYHELRMELKKMLDEQDIPPSMRAPFYGCLQELYKERKYITDVWASELIDRKYPIINDYPEIRRVIMGAVGLEYIPPEERRRTPYEKS